MSGYAKLFGSIVESSIWQEPADVCKVWITMLALADSEGFIRGSVGWLSQRCRVDIAVCQQALDKFQSPDPYSRTPDNDGKRIEATPDGWVILNYTFYRMETGKELAKDHRRTYQREWMRQKREGVNKCQQVSTGVDACKPSASASASSESVLRGCKGEEAHKPISKDDLKDIAKATAFVKLHPAFAKVPDIALHNVFNEFTAYRQHWPKMLRQYQNDNAGVDTLKYKPCQDLRIAFSRYIKFNNLPSPFVQA